MHLTMLGSIGYDPSPRFTLLISHWRNCPVRHKMELQARMNTSGNLVTCPCNTCSGQLEFHESRAGEEVPCPHCGLETILFKPPIEQVEILEPVSDSGLDSDMRVMQTTDLVSYPSWRGSLQQNERVAELVTNQAPHIVRTRKTSLAGLSIELVGFFMMASTPFVYLQTSLLWPVVALFGAAMMIAGYQASRVCRCSHCGNLVSDKDVKICPTCQTVFRGQFQPRNGPVKLPWSRANE